MKYLSYHILTIGCQMNKSDSERIASYLNSFSLRKASIKFADIVLLNTCGVRQRAEDRVYTLVRNIKRDNPKNKLIITGCLARRKDVQRRLSAQVDLFMPINNLPELIPTLMKKVAVNNLFFLDKDSDTIRQKQGERYLEIEAEYESKFSAFVPIGNGCDNFCSYCVVPLCQGQGGL